MKIFEYDSYGEYVRFQTAANKKKINNVFVRESTIKGIKSQFPSAQSILCHGTRNGAEIKFFQRSYGKDATVLGTEISDTATNYANTVQWDFMKSNPEWVGKYDIVYSNAFDHCTDPEHTLKVWSDQIKENGRLFIELALGKKHNNSTATDPLEYSKEEFLEIAKKVNLGVVTETKLHDGTLLVHLKKN